jgi:hypothetical protein
MLRILFLAFIILTISAFKYLSFKHLVGVLLLFALFMKFFGGKVLESLFWLPFKAKGKALRGAVARIHSVLPTNAPPPEPKDEGEPEDEGEEKDTRPRNYYLVDVTIEPKPATGKFHMWEAGELMLQAPGAGIDDEDHACVIKRIEFFETGVFQEDQGFKFEGAKRLRLLAAVLPGTQRLQFRYYFETFGEVVIR